MSLAYHSYFAMPQRPLLEPLFTDFTSVERSLLNERDSSDTDFEDNGSSIDEYEDYSPSYPDRRISQSTVSTVDEAPTPPPIHKSRFEVVPVPRLSVLGPSGPHLFRASIGSYNDLDTTLALQLSPLFSKDMTLSPVTMSLEKAEVLSSNPKPDCTHVSRWSSRQVAWWMLGLGFEEAVIRKFEAQEIDGSVLLDLQFNDLKALDIFSLTKRQRIWSELESLRKSPTSVVMPLDKTRKRSSSSKPSTPREKVRQIKRNHDDVASPISRVTTVKRRGRLHRANVDDSLTPAESVSIVAIEQLIPKTHVCKKGQNCPRWQRQQKLLDLLNQEHGCNISPSKEDQIFISGFPGNALDAERISKEVVHTPVLKTITPPPTPPKIRLPVRTSNMELQRDSLRMMGERGPYDGVMEYLELQPRQQQRQMFIKTPPAHEDFPHYEMFPTPPLPPLSPRSQARNPYIPGVPCFPKTPDHIRAATVQPRSSSSSIQRHPSPSMSTSATATISPPRDPISRQISASAPPSLLFQHQLHQQQQSPPRVLHSAKSPSLRQRPSFVLPTLHETPTTLPTSPLSPRLPTLPDLYGPGTTHAGWVKHLHRTPLTNSTTRFLFHGNNHVREEWRSAHMVLTGTTLTVYDDDYSSATMGAEGKKQQGAPLHVVDVKDYVPDCERKSTALRMAGGANSPDSPTFPPGRGAGSGGGRSLVAAVVKGLCGGGGGGGGNSKTDAKKRAGGGAGSVKDAPFDFHLVPCSSFAGGSDDEEGGRALRKGSAGGKRRAYFAVASAEERDDWFREVMLARALAQKDEGCEVFVDEVRM